MILNQIRGGIVLFRTQEAHIMEEAVQTIDRGSSRSTALPPPPYCLLLHILLLFFLFGRNAMIVCDVSSYTFLILYALQQHHFLLGDSLTPFFSMCKSARCPFIYCPQPISLSLRWTRAKQYPSTLYSSPQYSLPMVQWILSHLEMEKSPCSRSHIHIREWWMFQSSGGRWGPKDEGQGFVQDNNA